MYRGSGSSRALRFCFCRCAWGTYTAKSEEGALS